jgi:hypothetical protein
MGMETPAPASCPFCGWTHHPPHRGYVEVMRSAFEFSDHLTDAHWLDELESTDIAEQWAACTLEDARA